MTLIQISYTTPAKQFKSYNNAKYPLHSHSCLLNTNKLQKTAQKQLMDQVQCRTERCLKRTSIQKRGNLFKLSPAKKDLRV
ncbi:hypothetical protein EUGRSUZ_A00689 [Eucalyptus grandis]|uniref:Uncharacterized protein n=2 Tax=Eucalyptus grandis TaxID=71139 RepID=A0ACC3M108_EUCGR|nr:hypothetical protein EUGRSUZ_A00689 [Eucalyptus grandis]